MQQVQIPLEQGWSSKLGLALSHLFGEVDQPFEGGGGQHFALLDGVTASFSLSISDDEPSAFAPAWAWSAYLRKHVWVEKDDYVFVSSVARPQSEPEKYSLRSVEANLDRFLEYLSNDRQSPKETVVDQALANLDHLRQLAFTQRDDAESTLALHAFLLKVARSIDPNLPPPELAEKYALNTDNARDIEQLLQDSALDFGANDSTLRLHYGVAVRHAGGAIFQRATAQLTQLPQGDLFSGTQAFTIGPSASLRQGGYFTPPGLARSLAEAAIVDKLNRSYLRICDPACGSGVFLAEVLRALQRNGYRGRVELIGRDILDHAIEIAKFVVKCAANDFDSQLVSINIARANALEQSVAHDCDIVLMNPPFRSWEQSSAQDKENIRTALGPHFAGKPDLSLAFADMALKLLSNEGTLATLLPVGVLSADYAKRWRSYISNNAAISMIASLGDHYIFSFAVVNVAALVIRKQQSASARIRKAMMMWASEDPRASAAALRGLRKGKYAEESVDSSSTWRIYRLPQSELVNRQNWMPSASAHENLIAELRSRQLPRLGQLFKVRQGIRTGAREVFVLTAEQCRQLPSVERNAFRPIVEKDGILQFQISSPTYVFYADTLSVPIVDDADFKDRFPQYFEQYVTPCLDMLRARPSGVKIWQLSRSRTWLQKMEPRIVSRMFIGRQQFGFAVDERGDRAVVQGYGWVPNWKAIGVGSSNDDRLMALHAYAYLFSSELFLNLVQSVSVNIAGGQYDLAPKYIDTLPLPQWDAVRQAARGGLRDLEQTDALGDIFLKNPLELQRFAHTAFGL
jgi:type I restriction-modification system DNA methylase subunit